MANSGAIEDVSELPHGSLLRRKAGTDKDLAKALSAYETFLTSAEKIEVTDAKSARKLVRIFNEYRLKSIEIFGRGKNVPQSNLRSTMMEEFYTWLFKDIFRVVEKDIPKNFRIGKSVNSYISLTFAPYSFDTIFTSPNPRIAKKDQDFALGAAF